MDANYAAAANGGGGRHSTSRLRNTSSARFKRLTMKATSLLAWHFNTAGMAKIWKRSRFGLASFKSAGSAMAFRADRMLYVKIRWTPMSRQKYW